MLLFPLYGNVMNDNCFLDAWLPFSFAKLFLLLVLLQPLLLFLFFLLFLFCCFDTCVNNYFMTQRELLFLIYKLFICNNSFFKWYFALDLLKISMFVFGCKWKPVEIYYIVGTFSVNCCFNVTLPPYNEDANKRNSSTSFYFKSNF